jgi:beta-glucanase (GH16 family)
MSNVKLLIKQCFLILATVSAALFPHYALADPAPYGQPGNKYKLSFTEEFNRGFNTRIWNDHIWYEPSNPTKNYVVEDGRLKIWPQRDASGSFFNRTIDTDGKYYQKYGYFEMEAKLPVGKGPWPGFWIFNHIGEDRRPEVDIMEAYPGGGPDTGWSDANLHPGAYQVKVWQTPVTPAGESAIATPDLSAGFHKYGVKWEPNKFTFYFDGREWYSVNTTINDPLYILLDLWFGSASGTPDDTTPTGKGNAYEINYVRAWQFK